MCDKNMQLVKAIQKFPCLYNYNLPEYQKKETSEKSWNEVASQTQLSVAECKEKWKNLRYGLLRSLRLNADGTGKKKYYLHDEMEFIIPYIKTKQHDIIWQQAEADTDEDDQEKETSQEVQHQETENPEPQKKKSRTDNYVKYLQQKPNKNDEDKYESRKMFLLSLMPEVNALTENQMKIFRRKIFLLLDDIVDSPSQYEMCFLQWQKETTNIEQNIPEDDSIKKELI